MEMQKSWEFGEWTLQDILNDNRLQGFLYRIPNYQRGYAWQKRQWEEFWNDLCEVERRHYTGAITVKMREEEKVLDVVDGQQRLTTMAILLSVVDSSNNPLWKTSSEQEPRFSYSPGNDNCGLLEKLLESPAFETNGEVCSAPESLAQPENVYQRNLVDAKVFFSSMVSNRDWEGKQAIRKKILEMLFFDFRIIRKDDNAGIIFETMNNRGKPLTLLEKLKNRLLYLIDGLEEDDEAKIELERQVNDTWRVIYCELAQGQQLLDEDEFLAAHLSLYRNPKELVYSEAVAETRLFKMFCKNPEQYLKSEGATASGEETEDEMEDELSLDKISEYVDDLRRFALVWSAIHEEFDSACGRCRLLGDTRAIKVFLAAVWLKSAGENLQIRQDIFERAEQLVFSGNIGSGYGVDDARFATWGRRLYGKCLEMLNGKNRKELSLEGLKAEIEARLNEKKPDARSVLAFFADKMDGNFYKWSQKGLRYFLMRTEECGSDRHLKWNQFEDSSIEHVLPQSSAQPESKGPHWWSNVVDDFRVQARTDIKPEDLDKACERLVNSLGNLVLLTMEENTKVSNRAWETYGDKPGKRDYYLDPKHQSSSGARALAAEDRSWNAFRIRERGRKLLPKLLVLLGVSKESVGDSTVMSEDAIDKALGFAGDVSNLKDNQIPRLSDEKAKTIVQKEKEDRIDPKVRQILDDVFGKGQLISVKRHANQIVQFRTKKMDRLFSCAGRSNFYHYFIHSERGNGHLEFHPVDEKVNKTLLLERMPALLRDNLSKFPKTKKCLFEDRGRSGQWIRETIVKGKKRSLTPDDTDAIRHLLEQIRDWENRLLVDETGTRLLSIPDP